MEFESDRATAEIIREEDDYSGVRVTGALIACRRADSPATRPSGAQHQRLNEASESTSVTNDRIPRRCLLGESRLKTVVISAAISVSISDELPITTRLGAAVLSTPDQDRAPARARGIRVVMAWTPLLGTIIGAKIVRVDRFGSLC
jgi:hypothetical protein